MDRQLQTSLFASLARDNPRLKEWLEHELQRQQEILAVAAEDYQLRQAQGHAQALIKMLKLLEECPSAARR